MTAHVRTSDGEEGYAFSGNVTATDALDLQQLMRCDMHQLMGGAIPPRE
jgi:hypothetical protein